MTKLLESESFALAVLCHSLAEKQGSDITEAVHRRWPKIRMLMVVSNVAQELLYRGIEFDTTSSPDPNRLVSRTAEFVDWLPHHRLEESIQAEHRQVAS